MDNSLAPPWSQLPDDVLHRVLDKLCLDDYVACSTVCKSWNRAVDGMVSRLCPATQKVCLSTITFCLRLVLHMRACSCRTRHKCHTIIFTVLSCCDRYELQRKLTE